jgi:TPR repeat protein
MVGLMYLDGLNSAPKDLTKAREYLQLSANGGVKEALAAFDRNQSK